MGATGVTAKAAKKHAAKAEAGPFASAEELREVLDRLFSEIDGDADYGATVRSARVPHRLLVPDLGVVLNVAPSEEGEHRLKWEFSDDVDWEPALSLEMESEVANRYLQGRENVAIAIARGRITCAGHSRAALNFFSVNRGLIERYSRIVKREFPHLLLP
jgi:hypothetical protein